MSIQVLIALAVTGAQPQTSSPATEAPGPPLTTPLKRQNDAAPPAAETRSAADASSTPPTAALAPLTAGPAQTDRGVVSYPASFFAAMGPNTAYDMISRLPGFSFSSGSAVRGFDGAAGNVLLDGQRPVSKTDDLQNILVRTPASLVERIDVIRGGAPGVDMHGQTIIANVIRRKVASTTGVMAIVDQWATGDGRHFPGIRFEGTRRENGRVLEGSFVTVGFIDDGAGDGTRVRRDAAGNFLGSAIDKTEADGVQLNATGAYEQPLLGGRIRVNGSYLGQRYFYDERVDPVGPPNSFAPTNQRDHQNRQDGELGLNFTRELGPKGKIELIGLQQIRSSDYLSLFDLPGETDRFREQRVNSETIGRVVGTWRASRRLTVETGGEGAYNFLAGHSSFSVNGDAIPLPSAKVDVSELRGEVFAKANWVATRTLTAELQLRLEASKIESTGTTPVSNVFVFPKPRLALAWSPTKTDQFRLRLEREVGQLNFGDFTASSALSTGQILSGNPDLSPQQAWVAEVAYERRLLGDGSLTLTYRHSELQDVIDRAPFFTATGVFDAPANIGDGKRDDVIITGTLPLTKLGVKGFLIKPTIRLTRSEVVDPTTGKVRPISGLEEYDAVIAFSHDLPQWKMSYGGEFKSGNAERSYRFNQVQTDRFQPLVNLYFEYRPKPGTQWRIMLTGIGIDYDRDLSAYSGPRTLDQLVFSERRNLKTPAVLYARYRRSW